MTKTLKRMTAETAEQIRQTYRRMAKTYRPAAPSDGWGNITGPLNIKREADAYIEQWWDQEDPQNYFIGCPDWAGRPALIFTVEAANNICAMNYRAAANLLRLALEDVEKLKADPAHPDLAHPNTGKVDKRPIEEIFPPMD